MHVPFRTLRVHFEIPMAPDPEDCDGGDRALADGKPGRRPISADAIAPQISGQGALESVAGVSDQRVEAVEAVTTIFGHTGSMVTAFKHHAQWAAK